MGSLDMLEKFHHYVVNILCCMKYKSKTCSVFKLIYKHFARNFVSHIIRNNFNATYMNFVLQSIKEHGRQLTYIWLFKEHLIPNSSITLYWDLRWACIHGYYAVVETMLQDTRIDPNIYKGNSLICDAAKCGQTNIVRLLLNDSRIDPAEYNNEAIIKAIRFGNQETAYVLLEDDRVNPFAQDNIYPENTLDFARSCGYANLVSMLEERGVNNNRHPEIQTARTDVERAQKRLKEVNNKLSL